MKKIRNYIILGSMLAIAFPLLPALSQHNVKHNVIKNLKEEKANVTYETDEDFNERYFAPGDVTAIFFTSDKSINWTASLENGGVKPYIEGEEYEKYFTYYWFNTVEGKKGEIHISFGHNVRKDIVLKFESNVTNPLSDLTIHLSTTRKFALFSDEVELKTRTDTKNERDVHLNGYILADNVDKLDLSANKYFINAEKKPEHVFKDKILSIAPEDETSTTLSKYRPERIKELSFGDSEFSSIHKSFFYREEPIKDTDQVNVYYMDLTRNESLDIKINSEKKLVNNAFAIGGLRVKELNLINNDKSRNINVNGIRISNNAVINKINFDLGKTSFTTKIPFANMVYQSAFETIDFKGFETFDWSSLVSNKTIENKKRASIIFNDYLKFYNSHKTEPVMLIGDNDEQKIINPLDIMLNNLEAMDLDSNEKGAWYDNIFVPGSQAKIYANQTVAEIIKTHPKGGYDKICEIMGGDSWLNVLNEDDLYIYSISSSLVEKDELTSEYRQGEELTFNLTFEGKEGLNEHVNPDKIQIMHVNEEGFEEKINSEEYDVTYSEMKDNVIQAKLTFKEAKQYNNITFNYGSFIDRSVGQTIEIIEKQIANSVVVGVVSGGAVAALGTLGVGQYFYRRSKKSK